VYAANKVEQKSLLKPLIASIILLVVGMSIWNYLPLARSDLQATMHLNSVERDLVKPLKKHSLTNGFLPIKASGPWFVGYGSDAHFFISDTEFLLDKADIAPHYGGDFMELPENLEAMKKEIAAISSIREYSIILRYGGPIAWSRNNNEDSQSQYIYVDNINAGYYEAEDPANAQMMEYRIMVTTGNCDYEFNITNSEIVLNDKPTGNTKGRTMINIAHLFSIPSESVYYGVSYSITNDEFFVTLGYYETGTSDKKCIVIRLSNMDYKTVSIPKSIVGQEAYYIVAETTNSYVLMGTGVNQAAFYSMNKIKFEKIHTKDNVAQ